MGLSVRFSNPGQARQWEAVARTYPALAAAIERALATPKSPKAALVFGDPSLNLQFEVVATRFPEVASFLKSALSPAQMKGALSGRVASNPLSSIPAASSKVALPPTSDLDLPLWPGLQAAGIEPLSGLSEDPHANRVAIQAAIDSLPSSLPSAGGIVLLPEGTYPIDQAITLSNRVSLIGTREEATRLVAHGDAALQTIGYADPPPPGGGCVVSNLTLAQTSPVQESCGLRAAVWEKGGGPRLRNVTIEGFTTGILFYDRHFEEGGLNPYPIIGGYFEDVTIRGRGKGVGSGVDISSGANWLSLRRLRVSDVSTGVQFMDLKTTQPRSAVTICDCRFSRTKVGVLVFSQVAGLWIDGCKFEACAEAGLAFALGLWENGAHLGVCDFVDCPLKLLFLPGPDARTWVSTSRGGGYAEAPPADSEDGWEVGDILFNSEPTGAGSPIGWVCVSPLR